MIFYYGEPDAEIVLIQPVDDHDRDGLKSEMAEIRRLTGKDFSLIVFKVENWNKDLSPWPAPAVFGKEDFGKGAAVTLADILKITGDSCKKYYIGGYSLAALFALWAAYQTDAFRGVAAASPSLWFPEFTDYMKVHAVRAGSVYLSLGDREEKTRNPVMATIGSKVREAYDILKGQNVSAALEWNAGNHFREADVRTAKAFAWVMNQEG